MRNHVDFNLSPKTDLWWYRAQVWRDITPTLSCYSVGRISNFSLSLSFSFDILMVSPALISPERMSSLNPSSMWFLDSTLQWTRTKLYIISLRCHILLGFICYLHLVAQFMHTLEQTFEFNVDIFLIASRSSWSKVIISSKRLRNSGANCLLRLFWMIARARSLSPSFCDKPFRLVALKPTPCPNSFSWRCTSV